MNKNPNKYESKDHISRIQANLKEMKEEVNQFLKKQNNDKVPPILRARHYLILTCMNDINALIRQNSVEKPKVKKELSSEKLGFNLDSQAFQPMRETQAAQKQEKNKIVKQKRTVSGFKNINNNIHEDIDCLLPNICTLKLDCQNRKMRYQSKILTTRGHSIQHRLNQTIDASQLSDMKERHRKFHSIDLNMQNSIKDSNILNTTKVFKMGHNPYPISLQKGHIESILNKNNFATKAQQYLSSSIKDGVAFSNQFENFKKISNNQSQQIKQSKVLELNNNFKVDNQIKVNIQRRNYAKSIDVKDNRKNNNTPLPLKNQKMLSRRSLVIQRKVSKELNLDKKTYISKQNSQISQCSPWNEGDDVQKQKAVFLLENQFF